MDTPTETPAVTSQSTVRLRVFGVGHAGVKALEQLIVQGFPAAAAAAVDTEEGSLSASSAAQKIQPQTRLLRGLGSSGDPERGRELAEEHQAQFKSLCEGVEAVFILAGLGGGCGTGASHIIARAAKAAGVLVFGFVMTPFECEGTRRRHIAQQGLETLREAVDGLICLPNQDALRILRENASVLEAFQTTNQLLADVAHGIWRLMTHKGLIDINFAKFCELLREEHMETAFAVAEAVGATRSREAVDRLLAHPLLNEGEILGAADAVLVSLIGGPDLTMTEISRVMEELSRKCPGAQVTMGAAIAPQFQERLSVTVIAAHKPAEACRPSGGSREENLQDQLLRSSDVRSSSRFVPPAPTLAPDQMRQILSRQGTVRGRKAAPRMRQTQLPLEIISKGRFDKSEPTIHKGEDLDVPTYIRRGVALN